MADINDVLRESWQGHAKGEIEDALKSKLIEMEASIGQTDVFSVGIETVSLSEIQKDKNVVLQVKGTSKVTHPGNEVEDYDETLVLEVQTAVSNSAAYITKGTVDIAANKSDYTDVSLAPYLTSGTNYVRVRLYSRNSGATSIYRSFRLQVVELSIVPNMALEAPMNGDILELNYFIGGAIDKRALFEFGYYDDNGNFVRQYYHANGDESTNVSLGSVVNFQTGVTFNFKLDGLMTTGIHVVRAKLYVNDDIQTDVVETKYMVVQEGDAVPKMVLVNDAISSLDNYSDVQFFKYAAYGPDETTTVVFRLVNRAGGIEIARWEYEARRDVMYNFNTQLAVNLEDSSVTTIYAVMYIEDSEGNQLASPISLTISNRDSFSPVSGAEFVFNPSTRSNAEANPRTVINTVDGSIVGSDFAGFDMVSDGYMEVDKDLGDRTAGKVHALHIPAGKKLTINYNPFKELINSTGSNTGLIGKNMTFEIDFRTSNILDEDESVLKLYSVNTDGKIHGFEMKPTEAIVLTTDNRTIENQNVSWAEEVRTRLTVNVVYNLYGSGLNYVRMFINDTIEREFTYAANDRFLAGDTDLILGADNADIDVFGIRCYQKALSTNDVMQDYRSGLSDNASKLAWMVANNILGESGTIDFNLARAAGYNVLGHTGHLPKYGDLNKGKTSNISLYIGIHGEEERSGTLTGLDGSGQGTTAMTYYDWNQQYKTTDSTTWIGDDGNTERYGANGYAIADGEALAKKLVGKINFASSQQGHKMGLTRAYTDLFKQLIADYNDVSAPGQIERQPNARIAVYERPFLFFHRETENDPWTFKYLMTFGAGKGDKPTFGFDKKATPNMMMVEGADNDKALALFACPWDDDIVYDAENEAWFYGRQKSINFGFGTTDSDDAPNSAEALDAIKDFFNFAYLHNHSIIEYYTGNYEELTNGTAMKASGGENGALVAPDQGKLYWFTEKDYRDRFNQYDLFRFDTVTNTWVPAGINKEVLNVREQYEAFCHDLGVVAKVWGNSTSLDDILKDIKEARVKHFYLKAPDYIDVNDALYHSCFIKFFAGTDNRAKNTYYYTDPVSKKIRFMQDDLDTVIKTNNLGQNRKPYYVEEHDIVPSEPGALVEHYWMGETSGFYNLLEEAYATQMKTMMYRIFSCMTKISGSPMQFMEDYILQAQNYFPAVAYNEMARVVYEAASVAQNAGVYDNQAANAITQSNGTQKWSEYQWLKDRIMYISSWCNYGEFSLTEGGSNTLAFRGTSAVYDFHFKTAKWFYPLVNQGGSAMHDPVRVAAGGTFHCRFNNTSDSLLTIKGIDYYLDLGDMNIPLSASQSTDFTIPGKRLLSIHVNPDGTDVNQLVCQSLYIQATNIKEFVVRNVTTVTNRIDLSACTRLEKIDMRGCGVQSIRIPSTNSLKEIYYPSTITEISLLNNPSLTTVDTSEGIGNLSSFKIDEKKSSVDAYDILYRLYARDASLDVPILGVLELDNIEWTADNGNRSIAVQMLEYIAGVNDCKVTGIIEVRDSSDSSSKVTNDLIITLIEKFGNINSEDNELFIDYKKTPTYNLKMNGPRTIRKDGTYKFTAVSTNQSSNDVTGIDYSVSVNGHGITIDKNGYLDVPEVSLIAESITVSAVYHTLRGEDLTATKTVPIWDRPAQPGDFVYYDGDWSADYDGVSPVAGICFYINPNDPTDRRMTIGLIDNDSYYVDGAKRPEGHWGLGSNLLPDIVLNDDGNYNVYDVPGVANTGDQTYTTLPTTDENYLDDNEPDGFKKYNTATGDWNIFMDMELVTLTENIGGYKAGDIMPVGQSDTLHIIKHRNIILGYSGIDLDIPAASDTETEMASLMRLINKVANDTDSYLSGAYYYPMASMCYAYEPPAKAGYELADKFKAHHWYLCSPGEAVRIGFYYKRYRGNSDDRNVFKAAIENNCLNFTLNRDTHNQYSTNIWGGANKIYTTREIRRPSTNDKVLALRGSDISGMTESKAKSGTAFFIACQF